MKKLILATFFATATMSGIAQDIQKGTDKKGNLILEKNGKPIVNEKFDKVAVYSKDVNLIPAKLNGKWGFYDNNGKIVIPHQYDLLFCQNTPMLDDWYIAERIKVGLNGRNFFIDNTGKEDSTLDYDVIEKVGYKVDAYYLRKNNKYALADKDRKPLTGLDYQIIQLKSLDPVTYTGVKNGIPYRLSANGEEMGESETTSSNDNSKKDSKDKYKYVCEGCGAVEIIEGNASRPSPNKTHCPSPATKNSTSHKWKSMGKVK